MTERRAKYTTCKTRLSSDFIQPKAVDPNKTLDDVDPELRNVS
jgi:hypothetical protein